MNADVSKAVFLSYASQDAEAAKRICEALRQAGVEVWFDQSELVVGSLPEQAVIEAAEIDDGLERAFGDFAMIGHRHSGTVSTRQLTPHHDVTAGLSDPDKAMRRQNPTDFRRRQRAQFRHAGAGADEPGLRA